MAEVFREVKKTLNEEEFEMRLFNTSTGKNINRGFIGRGLANALVYEVDGSTAAKNLLAEE